MIGTVLIKGFTFRGYRSFPSDASVVLYPLRRVNLIAGQNNTGKSNILRVIADTFSEEKRPVSKWARPLRDAEHNFARAEIHEIAEVLTWGIWRGNLRAPWRISNVFFASPGSFSLKVPME
jgi:hypothetical protein